MAMEQEIKKEMGRIIEPKPQVATAAKEKNTAMAIVAYIVFFIPLLTEDRDKPFVKYHVKQGIVLFAAWIAAGILSMVPFIGWMLAPYLSFAGLVLTAIGARNAYKGEQKPLPLIGKYADNFKI
jgi:uncharacterized membrane protein